MALAENVAAPVLAVSASIVTCCAVFQSVGVKVRLAPAPADRPLLPAVRLTDTVTSEAGAADSATPKLPVNPCMTGSEPGLATMAGLTVLLGVQVRVAGAASLLDQVPWKPSEVLAPAATEPL